MHKYKILRSETPASAEQMEKFSNNGWYLKLITQLKDEFYYHFISESDNSSNLVKHEYKILAAISLVPEIELEKLSKESWILQSIINWDGQYYYYFARIKK